MTHLVTITHTLNNSTDVLVRGKLETHRRGPVAGRFVSGSLECIKGSIYRPVDYKVAVTGLTEEEIREIEYEWGAIVEEMPAEKAAAALDPATRRQISYLRDLGYKGSTEISKKEASSLISSFTGNGLTRADVDDFTGPEHTW